MSNEINATAYKVTLTGLRPLMFDRYAGDNSAKIEDKEKVYLDNQKQLVIPAANIISFMCAINTQSAAKLVFDKRKYKDKSQAILSFTTVEPDEIPILRDGKPIKFNGEFDATPCGERGIWLHKAVARLPKGIPNPKSRPVLNCPWSLEFRIKLFDSKGYDSMTIKGDELEKLFHQGGIVLGLGTFRGVYGKFTTKWERE